MDKLFVEKNDLLNSLSAHIAVISVEGVVLMTNKAWNNNNHLPLSASAGENFLDLLKKSFDPDHPEMEKIYQGIISVIEKKSDYFYCDCSCYSDEEEKWYTIRATPVIENGNVVITRTNITNRVLAEKTIQKSQEMVDLITSHIGEVIYKNRFFNKKIINEFVSANIVDLLGFTEKDYVNKNPQLKKSMSPGDWEKVTLFKKNIRQSVCNESKSVEYKWFHPIKKEWIWLEETVVPEIIDGKVVGEFGKITDITQQKIVETKFQTSEISYQRLFENMNEGLLFSSVDGIIKKVNPKFCKLVEYSEKELVGKIGYDLLLDDDIRDSIREKTKNRVAGKSENYDIQMVTKSGDKIWLHVSAFPHTDLNGNFIGVMLIVSNITEQKESQEKLLISENKFKDLFDYVNDAIVILNENGAIEEYNIAFDKLFNDNNEILYGKELPEIVTVHPEDYEKSKSYNKELKQKGSQRYEGRVYTKSGKLVWVDVNSSAIYDENGKCIGSRDVIRDITERKLIEIAKENSNHVQVVLNHLLKLSHSTISLNDVLKEVLKYTLKLPFIKTLSKGAIFLADDNGNLQLAAQKGLKKGSLKSCLFVEKGKCICGKVAASKKMIFTNSINHQHEIVYDGIEEHGHYAFPILQKEKLLGVLNVYLEANHTQDKEEVSILEAVTNTLGIIIAKKKAEEQQKLSEERLKEAQRIAKIGNWELDLINNVLFWSEEAQSIFEYDLEEHGATYETFLSTIHPEDVDLVDKSYKTHIKNKTSYSIEHRIITPNGTVKYVIEKCESEFNEKGEAILSKGTTQDITEQKKFENILNAISEISSTHGGDRYFTEICNLLCVVLNVKYALIGKYNDNDKVETYGFSINGHHQKNIVYDLENTPCSNVMENEACVYQNNIQELFPKDEILAQLGAESYIGVPLISNGETLGLIVIMDDKPIMNHKFHTTILEHVTHRALTEIKRTNAEHQIKESEERYRGLIENSQELTLIGDKDGIIKYISPSVSKFLEYPENEILGKNAFDFMHPEDQKISLSRYKNKQESKYRVYRLKTKSGNYKHVRGMMSYHFDKPSINGFIINAQDISELITAQEEQYKLILQTEEKERQRLAHDLHDGLGQTIAAANMYINTLNKYAKEQLDKKTYSLFKISKQLINNSAKETRLVSHNIMPRSIKEFGLEQTISEMMTNYQKISPEIQFKFNSQIKTTRFSEEVELTIYRSIQELMNNALKHACASVIEVNLLLDNNVLTIELNDDGKGFDIKKLQSKSSNGLGLVSIPQRIKTIGGDFSITSDKTKGTQATIIIKF